MTPLQALVAGYIAMALLQAKPLQLVEVDIPTDGGRYLPEILVRGADGARVRVVIEKLP